MNLKANVFAPFAFAFLSGVAIAAPIQVTAAAVGNGVDVSSAYPDVELRWAVGTGGGAYSASAVSSWDLSTNIGDFCALDLGKPECGSAFSGAEALTASADMLHVDSYGQSPGFGMPLGGAGLEVTFAHGVRTVTFTALSFALDSPAFVALDTDGTALTPVAFGEFASEYRVCSEPNEFINGCGAIQTWTFTSTGDPIAKVITGSSSSNAWITGFAYDVPEPDVMALLASGLCGFAFFRRNRRTAT